MCLFLVDIFTRTSKIDEHLPNTTKFIETRAIWVATLMRLRRLRVLYLCAMSSTTVLQTIAVESGVLSPTSVPFVELSNIRASDPRFYGYVIRTSEFRRFLKTDAGPPCFAYAPFDNDTFTALLSNGDSPYMYQHPYIFWSSIQKGEFALSLDDIPEPTRPIPVAMLSNNKRHAIATRCLLINAFGPCNGAIMNACFRQAIAEERHFAPLPKVFKTQWNIKKKRATAAMIASQTEKFQDFENWDMTEFVQLFMRLLNKNDLAQYLTSSRTINPEWFNESAYLRHGPTTDEYGLLREYSATRIVAKFIRTWTTLRRAKRNIAATMVQRAVWRWRGRKAVARAAARAENERHTQQRQREVMGLVVWMQRRARARLLVKGCAAVVISRAFKHWRLSRQLKRAAVARGFQVFVAKALEYQRGVELVISLQRRTRGFQAVAKYKSMQLAATKIQAFQRGVWARRYTGCRMQHMRITRLHLVKVGQVAGHLRHLFMWGRLIQDHHMMTNCLLDGTMPYKMLLDFPSIQMHACTVPDPIGLLVEASRHVGCIVATSAGILHMGFSSAPPVRFVHPPPHMVPQMVPVHYYNNPVGGYY